MLRAAGSERRTAGCSLASEVTARTRRAGLVAVPEDKGRARSFSLSQIAWVLYSKPHPYITLRARHDVRWTYTRRKKDSISFSRRYCSIVLPPNRQLYNLFVIIVGSGRPHL